MTIRTGWTMRSFPSFLFILPDILTLLNSDPPQFKSFSTHFYTRIANTTDSTSRDTELTRAARQISGDTRRANTNALLERWLFFPQHMGIDHWALLAVHIPSRHIHLLDSLIRSDHAEYLNRIRTLKQVLNKAWNMTSDTPPPVWQHTIRTDSPRQTNSVDFGVYMLAFCIHLYTNNELRFSTNMARHWRSRIALFLAHWTPSSPNSTAFAPAVTPQYPPTQTSPSPPQSSPPDKDSIIATPPPKPKSDSTTTPSSAKAVSTDTPKPTRVEGKGRGEKGSQEEA